jgi:NADP-reducing hydrogenase subunit HndD
MEEGAELLDRLTQISERRQGSKAAYVDFMLPGMGELFEHHFPDMIDIPSTARSPQQMFGAIAKTYFAEKINVKREDLVVVSIMPCVAKKYECTRDEFSVNGNPDVDYALSTRELANLIKRANINFNKLPNEEFDTPMGESTGAAVIFGTTGGVIEAATRSAYELQTGKNLKKLIFNNFEDGRHPFSCKVDFDGLELSIGIAHGLGNARKLLEDIKAGKSSIHAIEIMACPGGCIGGGGQPLHHGDSSSKGIAQITPKPIYT